MTTYEENKLDIILYKLSAHATGYGREEAKRDIGVIMKHNRHKAENAWHRLVIFVGICSFVLGLVIGVM